MTDQESNYLNEQVALAMGWYRPEGEGGLWCEGDSLTTRRLPDFCHDSHAVGWLLDFFTSKDLTFSIQSTKKTGWPGFSLYRDRLTYFVVLEYWRESVWGFTPGEALCRAIIAYAKAEQAKQEA
jgi:hypothetical protein